MREQTYFDYNATAPLRSQSKAAMLDVIDTPMNASAPHETGRAGRKAIETARETVAALCGAQASMVIFNSGATEGNNTVLDHFAGERILVSAIEHPSVLEKAKALGHYALIPVDSHGTVNLEALETLLKKDKTALVSVMAVNNETGVIQPIKEIAALAHKYGALYHCDGVQAAGRIPLNMSDLGIDFLTLSAHKIGGPQGVGALALGLCGITPSLLEGGGQEKRARPGTENVAGIAGLGAASQCALEDLKTSLPAQRDRLESEILKLCPSALIHGKEAPRVHNTTLFSIPGLSADTLLMAFDLEAIALSNGSACSSGSTRPSHVLEAMGISTDTAKATLRLSWGWKTTQQDFDVLLDALKTITARMQHKIKKTA